VWCHPFHWPAAAGWLLGYDHAPHAGTRV